MTTATTATVSPEILAREFSRILRSWLTPEQMQTVVTRNRIEASPLVCHSHDFCDANEAMAEAFTAHGISPFDGAGISDDTTTALWNAAWDLAKASRFYPPTPQAA